MRYVKGGSRKSDISLYIALYYLWAISYNKITISDIGRMPTEAENVLDEKDIAYYTAVSGF